SSSERLLLSGNYVSRFKKTPSDGKSVTDLQARQEQVTFYKGAIKEASKEGNLRDVGRAKLELGYLLGNQGETSAAESQYRAGLEDLRHANCAPSDPRWHSALARLHRDWADLLSTSPERTEEASALLQQAIAIHAYQGRKSQL